MAEDQQVSEFMRLFTSYEVRLRAFTMSLIPNWADADDVLQQANLVLWKKFSQFKPGTDFFGWAGRIIYLEAKDFSKRKMRARIKFGDEFLASVAEEVQELSEELAERQRVLAECLARLKPAQREILDMRYEEGGNATSIAQSQGRSVDAIYKELSRIRKAIVECVNRKLIAGGAYEL